MFHTTIHITIDQRRMVRKEAERRQDLGQSAKSDRSAVIRDAIDFMFENLKDFAKWQSKRRR
jgi:hypothetical protein